MKHRIACVLILSWIVSTAFAQPERPISGLQSKGQYKKIHRHKIQLLAEGKTDSYLEQMQKIWSQDSGDGETAFGLALAHAMAGSEDQAIKFVKLSLANGIDVCRYFAGPRELSKRIVGIEAFNSLPEAKDVRLLHGPMLGNLRSDGVDVWVRTRKKSKVEIQVRADQHHPSEGFLAEAAPENDYTAVVKITGLESATRYSYLVLVDGVRIDLPFPTKFRTLSPDLTDKKLTIAFGGGAGYTPFKERMWNTIGRHEPDVLFLLGDNVYIDLPESEAAQRYCYYRRQSRIEFRRLVASTPVYSVWDDHDFGTNDCHGGPEIDFPPWKRSVYEIFTQNWVNPGYGGGPENPGCYYSAQLGPIEFFFLDTRYYRSPGRSALGPVQLDWFLNKLRASTATFKVICSSVPMAKGTKPGSKDTWDGFVDEREKIFSTIDQKKVSGVFVLAADRHRSDVWKIERPSGYDTYEFMSSRLTNIHVHRLMKKSMLGYNEKCSFGLVTFDFTKIDPTVSYRVFNIDNEFIFEFQVAHSRLTMER